MAVEDSWYTTRDGQKAPTVRHGRGKRWRVRNRGAATRSFDRKVDAERHDATTKADLLRGSYIDPAAGRETFKAYAERWREVQQHRPATAALYERVLRLHVYPVLGDRSLKSVRHSDAQAFVTAMSAKLSDSAARQAHAITRTIFRSAVADRLIPSTPFERIQLPKVARGKVEALTAGQVQAIAATAPDRLAAQVRLAAGSGLRIGEVLGLSVDRVNFLRKTLTVDRQMTYAPGQPPYLGPPKTPESERTIPLPDYAVKALSAYLADHPARPIPVRIGAPDGPLEDVPLVFASDHGKPALRTTLYESWKRACRRAGLRGKVDFHHLRHSYASWLNAHGVPFTTIQELLGHAPQGVTWATYTHRVEGWDRQVRSVLQSTWEEANVYPLRTDRAN